MSVVIVIEPPPAIVTIDEARRHLVEIPAEDETYVESLILAATTWLDGPAGWLGRALGVQVLEWQRSTWPEAEDPLPFPPEIEIISVKYVDPQGNEQTWPFPTPIYWDDLPAIRGRQADLKIRYRAGYGSQDPQNEGVWVNSVPAPIKIAILMLVAQWYRKREAISIGDAIHALPFAVEALLSPYRVYR
jgi:uncharacterized phiE125 gp8 family phage protein